MIEQYEKEYQEAKLQYDEMVNLIKEGNCPMFLSKIVKDRYREAYQNLKDAKAADNQNKSRYGFW